MPKTKLSSVRRVLSKCIGSRWFFWLTVGLLVFEAVWIALSARYPQAFDEQFHFGLIQLYSHHWSPFLTEQPQEAGQFGAVARDPSYLYHYLMSFPYRFIRLFIDDKMTQIVILRLLNVALLASALFIFRRVLQAAKASPAVINFALFAFVLTPVTPLLAAQINYDNMLIPLVGISFLLTLQLCRALKRHSVGLALVLTLLSLWALGSVLKYAFLTVAGAEFIIVAIMWWRERSAVHFRVTYQTLWQKCRLVSVVIVTLLSLLLFSQRYVINLVSYYTLTPECDQVLSVAQCKDYGPWARNYRIHRDKTDSPSVADIAGFPLSWIYHVMGELVFTIGSGYDETGKINYYTGRQLISMEVLGWLVFGLGVAGVALNLRWLWRQTVFRLACFAMLCYVAALFGQNFLDYMHLGTITAVHGRYLLPFLPVLYGIIAMALLRVSRQHAFLPHQVLSGLIIIGAIMLVTQGGFVTYLLRQNEKWLRPNETVISVNQSAKSVVRTFTIDIPRQR